MNEIKHSLSSDFQESWCMARWEVINHIIKRYGWYTIEFIWMKWGISINIIINDEDIS